MVWPWFDHDPECYHSSVMREWSFATCGHVVTNRQAPFSMILNMSEKKLRRLRVGADWNNFDSRENLYEEIDNLHIAWGGNNVFLI